MGWQEYWRSWSFLDLGLRSLGFQNSNFCFSQKPLGYLKPNFIWKLMGVRKWKCTLKSLVTKPRWRPWPYRLKTLQKSSSPEPPGHLPWNLVCSIGDSGPIIICSNDDPGMTMTLFYSKVKFGHLGFSMGKSEKHGFFLNYCSLWAQSW